MNIVTISLIMLSPEGKRVVCVSIVIYTHIQNINYQSCIVNDNILLDF